MTSRPPMTRRHLFFAAGSGALGLAVLSGCSSASGPSASPSSAPGSASGTASASGGASGSASGAGAGLTWERVDLSFVSAYLLIRGDEVAIVDLGTDGAKDAIQIALTEAGHGWDAVRHVVLTHRHPDHAGGLAGVAPLVNATFYAGQADISGISSPKPLSPVEDGDEVFGLRIVGTPGHTLGHVSVFDPSTGVLVAGDALRTTSGLAGADPQYTEDPAEAAASVKKLAALDVRTILPGHGAPLTAGAAEALRTLAATL